MPTAGAPVVLFQQGAWTPSVQTGGTAATITHTEQVGWYQRIGNLVTVYFHVRFSCSAQGTGTLFIEGLPFVVRQGTANLNFGPNFYEEFRGLLTECRGVGDVNTVNAVVLEATVDTPHQGKSALIMNNVTGAPQTGHLTASNLSTTNEMEIIGGVTYITP